MSPTTDHDLLDRYIRHREASAFNQLVARHLNLVHAAALRRVRDPHLAEDIAQAVFLILSKKPNAARKAPLLSAWLLTTVRYASANALKLDRRRRRYEAAAAEAGGITKTSTGGSMDASPNPSDILIWREVASQLDDAILNLPSVDRRAILLRYFEDQPIGAIARSLNTTEAAARMRLSRSLEKLRQRLNRNGASLAPAGAASLTTLLAAHALAAAPPGLYSSIAAAASAGTAATTTATLIAKGAATMMTLAKAKSAALLAVVVSVLGTSAVVSINGASAQNPPPAPVMDLRALADARVQAAEKVIEMLDRRIQAGEALTPQMVELKATAQRRLAEARIDVAADPNARIQAAEQYVRQSRALHALLERRKAMDVSALQLAHSAYHLADAEFFLARLKSAQ